MDVDVKTVGDMRAAALALDPNWINLINRHWDKEFVSYDSQHWSALFMMITSTKVTRMIRYFGTRVSQCLFRLFKDKEGLTDKDRLVKYLMQTNEGDCHPLHYKIDRLQTIQT